MGKVNEQWKELRPQIGSFVSALDGLYKGAENIDEAISKAEFRGYEKGYKADKKEICNGCNGQNFYNSCNGYIEPIKKFMELSNDSKYAIRRLIEQLYEAEKQKEQS